MDTKDENNTKYVHLEEDQVYEAFNLTKIFTITFYDSFSIFIILSLCYHEKLTIASSLKDDNEDDEDFAFTKQVNFITYKADIKQSPELTWIIIINSATMCLFKQYDKTFLLLLPVSLYKTPSNEHTQKCFEKTLWLYQSPVQSTLIIQKTVKSVFNVNQMYGISNMISYVINHVDFTTKEGKRSSLLMFIFFTCILPDQEYILTHKHLLLEESDDVDVEKNVPISLKGLGYVDKQHFHKDDHNSSSISIVSGAVA